VSVPGLLAGRSLRWNVRAVDAAGNPAAIASTRLIGNCSESEDSAKMSNSPT